MGRWLMGRVRKKNKSEGWGREGERKKERETGNDRVLKELLASVHPQIAPALRLADIINVRHRQPSIAKCLINDFPSLAAATTQGS